MSDFEDSEFEYLTPLKDLSKHVWHGRAWIRANLADAALSRIALYEVPDDVVMWHDWFENSSTTYEITLTSTTRAGIMKNLTMLQEVDPGARLHSCYKGCGQVIGFMDWQVFTQ